MSEKNAHPRLRRELLAGIDNATNLGCEVRIRSDVASGQLLVKVVHQYGDNPARSMEALMPPHDYENRTPEIWMGHTIEAFAEMLVGKAERPDHCPPIIEESP